MKKYFLTLIVLLFVPIFLSGCVNIFDISRPDINTTQYTVTFDLQGGTNETNSIVATYAASMPTATKPTKAGNIFGGYYSEANGSGTQYYTETMASARLWDLQTNSILYAKWTVESHTIIFNTQGGNSVNNITANFNENITLPTAVRTGYNFSGWFTEINGAGTLVNWTTMPDLNNNTEGNASVTLYAKWEMINTTYTVTLDKQGGVGGSTSLEATYNTTMPTVVAPTREGYTFGGYYTSTGGSGIQYYTSSMASARPWDLQTNTTLYAYWLPVVNTTYTVTLNTQGGLGGTASVVVTYNATMPSATKPTKAGYIFSGYYTGINGSGTQYYTSSMASARPWDLQTNTTLYAKWIIENHTIIFNTQGGSTVNNITTNFNANIVLPTVVKTGYAFNGWYTGINGTGTLVNWTTMPDLSSNNELNTSITLYAYWLPVNTTYTVTLNTQGGIGGTASVVATYNATMPSATAPTRLGHIFGGYYTGTNGSGTQYYTQSMASARPWDLQTNTTLYAKWTIETHTILFNTQGGSTVNNITANFNANIVLPTPTRIGYTFSGWFTGINGTGTRVIWTIMPDLSSGSELNASTTLYASWLLNTYAVTLDSQGGIGGTASVTATYGVAMPSATAPTRADYVFDGYYTGINGTGIQYYTQSMSSVRPWDLQSNTTLYAKWIIEENNALSITFNYSESSQEIIQVELGQRYPSNGTFLLPSREQSIFMGWYDNEEFLGEPYDYIEEVNSSINLFAKWIVIEEENAVSETQDVYVIMFIANGGFNIMENQSFEIGETKKLSKNTFIEPSEDYYFAGWALTPSGEVVYLDEQEITPTGNDILYAIWLKKAIYRIDFNANGGNGTMNYYLLKEGSLFTLPPNEFLAGYGGIGFAGWSVDANTSVEYRTNDVITVNSNMTFYAVWKMIVSVQFNANGGTGTMGTQVFQVEVNQKLNANTFVNPNNNVYFAGWATSATGNVIYLDEQEVSFYSYTTLYAVWKPKTYYIVTFNSNGGYGTYQMPTLTVEKNVPTKLLKNEYIPPYGGVAFGGWALTSSGEAAYINEQVVAFSQNTTLYAKWIVRAFYTVTFNPNGGVGSSYTQSVLAGTLSQLNANTFNPPYGGIAFMGWATSSNGTVVYKNNEIAKFTSNQNLYAVWGIIYRVYLNPENGGATTLHGGILGSRVPSVGVFPTPKKDGYAFGGWYTQKEGQGQKYDFVPYMTSELNLYAYWLNPYMDGKVLNVKLYLNYDNLTLQESGIYNSRVPEVGNFVVPTRANYLFLGWYTGVDGFGEKVDYIESIKTNTSLYAHWKYVEPPVSYIVTFNSQGGTTQDSITAVSKSRVPSLGYLPQPTRSGYIFAGWYTGTSGTGTKYEYIQSLESNLILYARWVEQQITMKVVTFNSNGGEIIKNVYVGLNTRAPSSGNFQTPIKPGYAFIGWYDNASLTGTVYNYISNLSSDITLYAKWQVTSYTVTFNSNGGSPVSSISSQYNLRVPTVGEFSKPTRSGYVFMGWLTEDGLLKKYIKNIDSNVTLYAKWHQESSDVIRAEQNYQYNLQVEAENKALFNSSGFINDQPLTSIFKYGNYTSDKNGCGWIATYNALRYLQSQGLYDEEIIISDIIRYYEHYGLAFDGKFGTYPDTIIDYLKMLGFDANMYSNTSKFDTVIKESDVTISWCIIFWTSHYQVVYEKDNNMQFYNPEFYYPSYNDYMEELGLGIYQLISINVK